MEIEIRRLPRVYEHFVVFTAFSLGALGAGVVADEWSQVLSWGWCFLAIAWFPSVCLEFFRRRTVDRHLVISVMLSMIAGFDGLLRLVRQTSAGC